MEEPEIITTINSNSSQKSLPNSTAVLVLGILSIVFCFCLCYSAFIGLVLGIIALVLANKDLALYNESPSSYSTPSYNNLKAGRVCAIIGTILCGLVLLVVVVYFAFVGSIIGAGAANGIFS